MKIGILSFYYKNDNYGGLLQAYALQQVMSHYGNCEQICFDMSVSSKRNKKLRYYIKKIPRKTAEILERIPKRIWNKLVDEKIENSLDKRKRKFKKFAENIEHSNRIYNVNNIEEMFRKYDIIVVGSDQVWANWLDDTIFEVFTLYDTSKKCKTFSYAASIGSKKIKKEHKEILQQNLEHFVSVSLREKTSKKEVEKLLKNNIPQSVLDPTMLLEKSEWDLIEKGREENKKYIFCYLLGKSIVNRRIVSQIAKKLEMEIVFFPYSTMNEFQWQDTLIGGKKIYDADPEEFIHVIKNAELVITDSFHAMVFSCIYRKKFFVLMRDNKNPQNTMNSRIRDYLEMFNLKRALIKYRDLKKINDLLEQEWYTDMNKILEYEIDQSKLFIATTINNIYNM